MFLGLPEGIWLGVVIAISATGYIFLFRGMSCLPSHSMLMKKRQEALRQRDSAHIMIFFGAIIGVLFSVFAIAIGIIP